MHFFLGVQTGMARNIASPVEKNTPSTQNLGFNIIPHYNELGLLEETADIRSGTGEVQGKPGRSQSRKEGSF